MILGPSMPAARVKKRSAVVFAFAMLAACGGSPNPPPTPGNPGTPGTPGAETITGRERIGWAQPASTAAELATYDFAMYVDGARHVLNGEACTAAGNGTFDCSAPLPPLNSGQRTLELAAFFVSGDTTVESLRSAAIRVVVAAATAPAEDTLAAESSLVTSTGRRFTATIVARALDDPTDMAIAPDGRILIAERRGRIRVVTSEGLAGDPAAELADVVPAIENREAGLTAIALHPGFERNGFVYVAYAAEDREGGAFVVARFRERDGILGQRAVVSRHTTPWPAHVTARFGPDGMLYTAYAAGNDPRDAQSASSVHGKIVRTNDDGTTPADSARSTPFLSSGHREPRALVWRPGTNALWEVERDREGGDELNAIVRGADYGWPLVRGAASNGRSVPASLVLPPGSEASGAAFLPATGASPFPGELLVAMRGGADVLRVRTEGRRPAIVEGLLEGRYGRIAAVNASEDGSIFFLTGNMDSWGAGRDILVRLRPAPPE
jgi:glucose/arabinose dehydrogenase